MNERAPRSCAAAAGSELGTENGEGTWRSVQHLGGPGHHPRGARTSPKEGSVHYPRGVTASQPPRGVRARPSEEHGAIGALSSCAGSVHPRVFLPPPPLEPLQR